MWGVHEGVDVYVCVCVGGGGVCEGVDVIS